MENNKIDQKYLDALRELANIGVGNAVTSLSQMLGEEKIKMEVPEVSMVSLQDIPESLGGAEFSVAGVYIEASGGVKLTILFALPLESAGNLISALLPQEKIDMFDEMSLSVLTEVGNILTSSYLTAISYLTDLQLMPSPPQIAIDMAGAIITTVLAEAELIDEEVLLLTTTLFAEDTKIEGNILIIPDAGALSKIFSLMGLK